MRKSTESVRFCEECSAPLPATSRSARRFCGKRCYSKMQWRTADKAERAVAHRAWRLATRDRRLAALAEARGTAICRECGAEIADAQRKTRRFCSRKCVNVASLRDAADQRLANNNRRRARMQAANSPGVSPEDWNRLVRRHDGKCAYCGAIATLTRDHVVPISRGGWDAIGNILPACFPCNASKCDDLLVYWLRRIPHARLKRAS